VPSPPSTRSCADRRRTPGWAPGRPHGSSLAGRGRASPAKLDALRRFPATVVIHGDSYEAAEQHAKALAKQGLRYVSSNDPDVIAG
jgi:hypothetical protein